MTDIFLQLLDEVVEQGISHYQQGTHGAVLDLRELPPDQEIILIGDLHTKLKHLQLILEDRQEDESGAEPREPDDSVLQKLEDGRAMLVILGDAVHFESFRSEISDRRELQERLREMQSSLTIMAHIFDLKLRFPDRVHYVLGNHDYLSGRCVKDGVRQGLELKQCIEDRFGKEAMVQYWRFLRNCPVLLVGDGIVAAHAGPAHGLRSLDEVLAVNPAMEEDPVVQSLVWGRFGANFEPEQIHSFLRAIGQEGAYFVVGHSPHLIPKIDLLVLAKLCGQR